MSLLNYREAAELLGIQPATLRRWTRRKRVPHLRFGTHSVKFDRAALLLWIDQQRVAPDPGDNAA